MHMILLCNGIIYQHNIVVTLAVDYATQMIAGLACNMLRKKLPPARPEQAKSSYIVAIVLFMTYRI